MKKIIALALSLIMILCAVCAFAETAEKTEMGTLEVGEAFRIQSKMPEGYTYMPVTSTGLNMVGMLSAGEGRPVVTVSIAYNEEYADVERFNDVEETVVEEIRDSFREVDEDLVFEDLETVYGTRLLKVAGSGFVDIYTIYKGYELEFVMTPGEGQELTEEAVAKMIQFISDMEFVPVA